jgi:hypothetical protein
VVFGAVSAQKSHPDLPYSRTRRRVWSKSAKFGGFSQLQTHFSGARPAI